MYTSSVISKIELFDMSWPRVSCMWVCKTGITIVIRDHLGIPLYAKASCLLGVSVPLYIRYSDYRDGLPKIGI